jgi:hypothetical protein
MKLRVARHTNNLDNIKEFYTNVLSFQLLGSFKNHKGYNGVFIGKPGLDWHLEFTQSNEKANHVFDEDDILVWYPSIEAEYNTFINKIKKHKIKVIPSKNPYWNENGTMILDPDGYRILIAHNNPKQ